MQQFSMIDLETHLIAIVKSIQPIHKIIEKKRIEIRNIMTREAILKLSWTITK